MSELIMYPPNVFTGAMEDKRETTQFDMQLPMIASKDHEIHIPGSSPSLQNTSMGFVTSLKCQPTNGLMNPNNFMDLLPINLTDAELADVTTTKVDLHKGLQMNGARKLAVLSNAEYDLSRWLLSLEGLRSNDTFFYIRQLRGRGFDSLYALKLATEKDLVACGLEYKADCSRIIRAIRFASVPKPTPDFTGTLCAFFQSIGVNPDDVFRYSSLYMSHGCYAVTDLLQTLQREAVWSRIKEGHQRVLEKLFGITSQTSPVHQYNNPELCSQDCSLAAVVPNVLQPNTKGMMGSQIGADSVGLVDMQLHVYPIGAKTRTPRRSVRKRGIGSEVSQEALDLLHDAISTSPPNPYRGGKKIHWNLLSSGKLGDPRFELLTQYSVAQLRSCYTAAYGEPGSYASTADWSDESMRLLSQAINDPVCKSGRKIRWELIATGKTRNAQYTPLSKFTAAQLRACYRSNYGDKKRRKVIKDETQCTKPIVAPHNNTMSYSMTSRTSPIGIVDIISDSTVSTSPATSTDAMMPVVLARDDALLASLKTEEPLQDVIV